MERPRNHDGLLDKLTGMALKAERLRQGAAQQQERRDMLDRLASHHDATAPTLPPRPAPKT